MPLPYHDALRLTRNAATPLDAEAVPLAEAVGRVTARPVLSAEQSPNADLAAMDGFAVRAADLRGATAAAPHRLAVAGAAAAGDLPTAQPPRLPPALPPDAGGLPAAQPPGLPQAAAPPPAGTAVRVATGALLPAGYDSVAPLEEVAEVAAVEERGAAITLTAPVAAGANVRRAGEDHRPGDVVLDAGRRLGPAHVLLLANLGCARLPVVRQPRVTVLATGNEVVADLTAPLRPGQVRNSNARYLLAALTSLGCEAQAPAPVPDHPQALRRALRQALAAAAPPDLIVTIGGVSRGAADFVPAALEALGAEYLFRGVALRPGKPVTCARLPHPPTLLFGLPGNPLAVLATFRALVAPCLQALQGLPAAEPATATLGAAVRGRPPLTRLLLARGVRRSGGGPEQVVPAAGQKASQVGALRAADRWLVVPPDAAELPAGAEVATLPL